MVKNPTGRPVKYTPERMKQLESWVRGNYLRSVTIADVLRAFPWARRRALNMHNFNPVDITLRERLKQSIKYVRKGKEYSWVARKLKFWGEYHYARKFKERYGMTPKQYVNKYSKKR